MRWALAAALPVAMAFGPAMPQTSFAGLARSSANCRAAAVPPLRMAVKEVGSESELDEAIAGAGIPFS